MPDIKLKNGSGVEQTYTGVDTITVPLADGTGNYTFGLTDEELTFEAIGDIYLFTKATDAFWKKWIDRIKFVPTSYGNDKYYVFTTLSSGSETEDLSSITIDCKDVDYFLAQNMFAGTDNKIKKLPKVINNENTCISCVTMFTGNSITEHEILEFLEGFTYSCERQSLGGSASQLYGLPYSSSLNNALDLSEVNAKWHSIINNEKSHHTYNSSPNYSGIYQTLEYVKSIRNIPIQHTDTTKRTSSFNISPQYKTLHFCDSFAFATDNGTPYSMNWKSMVLDIGTNDIYPFGYGNYPYTQSYKLYAQGFWKVENNIFTSNSMTIEEAKSRYDQLKNREDWYSVTNNSVTYDGKNLRLALLFSRYNHDSAVETLNSLPDTSAYLATAGGTNTIKFKGYSGALTDGGAINTLTDEEIAVAAAKGWTVTLV